MDGLPQSGARHHCQVKDPTAADMRVHCLPRWPRGAVDARNSGVEPMNRIETYRVFGLCVALASGAPLLQGCSDSKGNPPPTGTGGGGTGQAVTYCTPPYPAPLPLSSSAISDFDGEGGALVQSLTAGSVC